MDTVSIIITTQQTSRFTSFWKNLMTTRLSPNTEIKVMSGPYIAENRNKGIQDSTGDYLWFLDDDHVWDPLTLNALLAKQQDIVGPLIVERQPPFLPVAKVEKDGQHVPVNFWDSKEKLIEVNYTGAAGLLVKREVFNTIPYPWFYADLSGNTFIGEDIYFCRKAQQYNYKIFLDLTATMGHTNIYHAQPKKINNEWKIELDFGNNKVVYLEKNEVGNEQI